MSKPRSAMFKEAWFNPNSMGGNLVIIDRSTGKVQEFKLESQRVELRYKYEMTEEDKVKAVKQDGAGYDEVLDPEDSYGSNGWKRMRRLEESD